MIYEKVIVRQIPDDVALLTGLHKYNKSKMPSTSDFVQPAEHNGRIITGIDENSFEIERMQDLEEKEKIKSEVAALRANLEKLTGKDLSATSTFWNTFGIRIPADADLILNRTDALHVIMYHVLIANGYVAPDKDSAGLPKYRNAKYYCHIENVVNDEEVSTQKYRDKARGELLKLAENDDKMVAVGQYLEGDKYKKGMRVNTVYKMLSDYLMVDKDHIKNFLKAINLSNEELQFKIVIDRAFKKKIIRYTNKYYQRGQVTLGRTPTEVYENLKTPEFASEFLSIQSELE